jgi:hypothetical protein
VPIIEVRNAQSGNLVALPLTRVRPLFHGKDMAKRAALFPTWVETLDAMIAEGTVVRVMCTHCSVCENVELQALREKVGGTYSLVNRRCRCRLTPGCAGWNRFYYLQGCMRPLWDDAASDRWCS